MYYMNLTEKGKSLIGHFFQNRNFYTFWQSKFIKFEALDSLVSPGRETTAIVSTWNLPVSTLLPKHCRVNRYQIVFIIPNPVHWKKMYAIPFLRPKIFTGRSPKSACKHILCWTSRTLWITFLTFDTSKWERLWTIAQDSESKVLNQKFAMKEALRGDRALLIMSNSWDRVP